MAHSAASHPQAIRTAVFGFGLGGKVFHAPLIAANPRYSLDVIVTSDPARQESARASYPKAHIVSRPHDALAYAHQLDLAVVATPPATHGALVEAALEAGLAVVVDKPFVPHAPDAERIIAYAERRGLALSVYQNRRWDGDFLTVKKLLGHGALGTVHRFESRIDRWQPVITKVWKRDTAAADGGGILYDLGPHVIDQALQLFGPAELLYAEIAANRGDGGPDDDVFLALKHTTPAGTVVSHLALNGLAAQAGPRFRVLGSKAAYVKWGGDGQEPALIEGIRPGDEDYGVEPAEAWGTLGVDTALDTVPTERGNWPAFYEQMAAALRDGGPVPVEPRDSLAVLRIIEEAHRRAGAGG
jgi:predicted dehydrogenase